MKKLSLFLLFIPFFSMAQVGIGTSTPDASARLQVDAASGSNAKGFLPPRVSLTATNNIAPFTATPATGILVYNTITAGTSPNNVTPVFYYYDGAKWQRIINQQPDATVEFNTANPNSGSPVFTPNSPASTGYIYVSSVDYSQWTYNGSTYVTYTPTPSTGWYLSGGTTDAGSNKSSAIVRPGKVGIGNNSPNARLDIRTSPSNTSNPGEGYIGIGTTTSTANAAGAGAIRYNTLSGGTIEYSNGVSWNLLTSTVQKATVVAKKTTPQTFSNAASSDVTGWDEITDVTGSFDPASGVFTAPRTGNYVVSFSYSFISGSIAAGSWTEAILVSSGGSTNDKKSVVSFPALGNAPAGASISFVIRLAEYETVKPLIYHTLGGDKTLRVGTGANDGFVNFSVAEL